MAMNPPTPYVAAHGSGTWDLLDGQRLCFDWHQDRPDRIKVTRNTMRGEVEQRTPFGIAVVPPRKRGWVPVALTQEPAR